MLVRRRDTHKQPPILAAANIHTANPPVELHLRIDHTTSLPPQTDKHTQPIQYGMYAIHTLFLRKSILFNITWAVVARVFLPVLTIGRKHPPFFFHALVLA